VPKKPDNADDSARLLRSQAESRLRDRQKGKSELGGQKSEADIQRLLHELEVHQVELEMQNEELSEARDQLEMLLEKYTDLYDFAPVGYLTLDPAGNVRETNLTAAALLGVARSVLVNRRFGPFVAAADLPVFKDFLEKTFASKVRQSCEIKLQVANGPVRPVALEGIVFESGKVCRVTLTDITELKRAEADRTILSKLEATGILAGGIAHDFNNLLSVILLNLELAQMLDYDGKELAGYLEEAKKSGLLAQRLTAQLVTFSDGGTLIRQAVPLPELIKESVRHALSGSLLRCEFFLAEDLWPADVDAAQLGQVIRNLILNAREAMPKEGSISVRARNVQLRAREQTVLPAGEFVEVSIADQGTGIAQDVLPKIFDPYFSTKQRGVQKGMGLGLTICHSIVKKHHGTITVESIAGVGTTFHIYLPANRKLRGAGKPLAPGGGPQPARVIITADDEEESR